MKSYTDLEQSKKLTEILPLESADMLYYCNKSNSIPISQCPFVRSFKETDTFSYLHCWSLAALLNSVKYNTINLHYNDARNDWIVSCTIEHSTRYESERALNPIDAVFEMIIKLYQQKLL